MNEYYNEEHYAKICPDFKWIYGYEDSRDEWVVTSCHWCLNLNEESLPKHLMKAGDTIIYKCSIPEREIKHKAWLASQEKGQVTLV
jgi:hypothetical protein